MFRIGLTCSGIWLCLSVATHAQATPNFPDAMRADLGLASAPDCLVCHNNELGGRGTVKTPFGKSLVARGLLAFSTSTLQNALNQMEADRVNSAGGCLTDIEELQAGRDPNNPGDAADCDGGAPITAGNDETIAHIPQYGCRGSIAPASSGLDRSAAFLALLTASAFALRARLRRQRAPR